MTDGAGISRRNFLKVGAGAAAAVAATPLLAACGSGASGGSSGKGGSVKVGAMADATGDFASYGEPTIQGMHLAVDEINAAGGVLGKKIDLDFLDCKTDVATWTSNARQLLRDPSVVALINGGASNEREAYRNLVAPAKKLLFYNHQYEGGLCDKNVFSTGIVPDQQVKPLVQYMVGKYGKRIYVLAADYNYGHIASALTAQYAQANNAQILGTDYFPLTVSDFGTTISKIEQLKPDFIVSHLVGNDHLNFHRQMASTGLNKTIPVGAPVFGLGNEQFILGYKDSQGILSALNYYQDVDTPASKAFVKKVRAKYPKVQYVNNELCTSYTAWKLWAAAVKKAGSTDTDKMIKALESGVSVDSPEGTLTMNGETHQLSHNIYITKVNSKLGFDILQAFKGLDPKATQCNLIAKPDQHTQLG